MLSFIFPLLYLICTTGFLVFVSKRTFGKCLPITMMLSAFSYFISQVLFDTFKIGFAVNILIAVVFIIIMVWNLVKRKDLKDFKERFLSKGFYAFLAVFTFIFLFDWNRTFSGWDEWSHWGPMIKEMMRLDRFYTIDASILAVHKGYPPIVQLMELFFCNLQGGFNGYKEAYLLRSLHLFNFSLLIPAIFESDEKYSKIKLMMKTVLFVVCAYFLILLFDQHSVINTIYLDYTMASLTAYLLAQVLIEKEPLSWSSLIGMSVGLSFLVLTKQIALTMVAMVLFMFIINLFIKKELEIKKMLAKKSLIKMLKVIVLLIVIPLVFWEGWSYYTSHFNLASDFNISDIKLNELQSIINGESGESWQKQTATNYLTAIKDNNFTTSKSLYLSYFQSMIVILFMLYLVWKLGNGSKFFQKGQLTLAALTLIIGMIGYAFMMLILYVFTFGPVEGPNLASINRYIPTYLIIGGLFVLYLFVYVNTRNDKEYKNFACVLIILGSLITVQNPNLIERIKFVTEKPEVTYYEEHANNIMSKTKENDKIFIIAADTTIGASYFTQYYMMPRTVNFQYYNFSNVVDDYEKYFYNEVNDYMLEYDYLYIEYIDDNILNNYNFLFKGQDVLINQIYKINNKNGKVELKLVA